MKKTIILKYFKIIFPLVCLLSIGSLAVLLYYSYNEALSLIKDQYSKQQILVAKQTALGIERNIKLATKELEQMSLDAAIKKFNLRASRTIMAAFKQLKDLYINDIRILDSRGILRDSLSSPHLVGQDFSGRKYFKTAKLMKTGKTVFEFITFNGTDMGKSGIVIAMPLFFHEKKFSGVVVFTIKVNELIKGFIPLQTTDRESCVIDSKGNILCNPKRWSGKIVDQYKNLDPAFKTFLEKVMAGKIVTGEYLSPDGIKTISVSYPLKIENQTWSMILATPEEVLHNLLKPFSVKYTVATLIALFLVASASFLIIYFINVWNIELDSMVKIRTKELALSEGKLRGMVETINDLIWEVDADLKYVYVSPLAKEILGYEPEELIGKTIFDLMPEGDAQKLKETLQEIGYSKRRFSNLERNTIHKSGKHIILETNGAPILDDAENLTGFRGADRDVTERKQAEKELQNYAIELESARSNLEQKVEERTAELKKVHEVLLLKEKLATLGELASSVSHELRNPLGVIKNAIYFFNMKMNSFEDEAIKENIQIITREINIANKIISDLLDFTRGKPPVRLDIDINQLVKEMLSKSLIPANIKVVTDLSEKIPTVSVDPTQIAQIFLNFIENAVQSMEKGGTLKVISRQKDSAVEVAFADEGCGISADNLERIFEPLFTTKAKGIGLGLAVSKNLIEANGGRIDVESEEGRGSTFTITFERNS